MDYYDNPEDRDYGRYRRGRRPSPRRNISDIRRSTQFLDPNFDLGGAGLYRTRSQGQAPVPIVNTFVDVQQDNNNERSPSPYANIWPPSPGYGRSRRADRLSADLVDAIEDLRLDVNARTSRSRGRSDVGYDRDYYDWERRRRSEEDRIKREISREEAEAKEREKRIIDDFKRKERDASEERKEEEKKLRDKIKQEEKDAKDKEEREWQDFLRKQKDKEEEEKEKKRKKEEEIDEALRDRFLNMGYSKATADRMIEVEKLRRGKAAVVTSTSLARLEAPRLEAPTYAKVKREHIAIETLKYFDIPWEYDRKDKKYIIILREMTEVETDMLFEHTKQLREKKLPLLLEPAKREPQYAFYRKRDRSTSRVRKAGILRYGD